MTLAVLFAQGIERVFNNLERTGIQIGSAVLLVVAFFVCIPLLAKSKVGGIILIMGLTLLLGGMVVAPDAWWNMIEGTTDRLLQGS
jgi:hypothetical protein